MSFHVKFGSSASKVYAQIEGNPKTGERGGSAPLGWGMALETN